MGQARVTQAGVYVEASGHQVEVTQAGVYVELAIAQIHVTQAGVYIELVILEVEEEMPTYFPNAAGNRASHTRLPDEQTGYAFDAAHSWWSTIVPEESENLIINSSFELGSSAGGWQSAGSGQSLSPVSTGSTNPGATHGNLSMRLDPNDANAVFYTEGFDVEIDAYTFSMDIYATRPCVAYLFIQDDSNPIGATSASSYIYRGVQRLLIDGTGWKRYHVTGNFFAAATARVGLFVEATPGLLIYMDAMQLEQKPYPTTYIHGDMIGSKDTGPQQSYYWRGALDLSTAVRRKRTGSGGRIVSWSDEVGFLTTSIVGAGMSPVETQTQETGIGKTIHVQTRAVPGNFSVIGRVFGCDYVTLMRKRNELVRLLKPDNSYTNDMITLRYEYSNGRGEPFGAPLEIVCSYADGLGGNITNFYQENIPVQFYAPELFWQETIDSAYTILPADTALSKPFCKLVLRNSDGEYVPLANASAPDYATTGDVNEVDFLSDGTPIAVGDFSKLCGFAGVSKVATWEDGAWATYGTLAGDVNITSVDASGRNGVWPPIIGVQFVTSGTAGIYQYNSGTDAWDLVADSVTYFSSLKYPTKVRRDDNGDIYFIAYDDEGGSPVYRMGVIQGGVIDAVDFDWGSTILPGAGHHVDDIVIADDQVYFLGNFQYDFIGNPDPASWGLVAVNKDDYSLSPVGRGLNGRIRRGWMGSDGFLYVVGDFTKEYYAVDDPGNAIRGFGRWDGDGWTEVANMIIEADTTGPLNVHVDRDGIAWISMKQTGVNHVPSNLDYGQKAMLGYKKGVYYPPFVEYDGVATDGWISALNGGASRNNADLFLLYSINNDESQDMWLPQMLFIENHGDAETLLSFRIEGGSGVVVRTLRNMEASMIAFRDFGTLHSSDHLIINNQGRRALVYDSNYTQLNRYLAGGFSDLRALKLFPGINRVQIFVTGSSSGGYFTWRNRYWGLGSFVGQAQNASIVYGPDRTE